MPFKSKAQRGYMFAHHPEMAKEWASGMTHKEEKRLPEHVEREKKERQHPSHPHHGKPVPR